MLAVAPVSEAFHPRGHRPTLTSTSISSMGSLSIPRIRILLAPYMSPYVVPLKKVETWELLLDLLSKLFGPSILSSILNITDAQGNVIHRHVWQDLLEPGMTIIVATGSFTSEPGVKAASGERLNRRGKLRQNQVGLALEPPDPPVKMFSFPRPPESRDVYKAATPRLGVANGEQQETKLPPWILEPYEKTNLNSNHAAEKRVTTVDMFLQPEMNGSRVTLGQVGLGEGVEKTAHAGGKRVEPSQRSKLGVPNATLLSRKKSTVARVADCFHGIKSRYNHVVSKDVNPSSNLSQAAAPGVTSEQRKEGVNVNGKEIKSERTQAHTTTTSESATATSESVSNEPAKTPKRMASLKALFRYHEDGKTAVPHRARSIPTTQAANKGKAPMSPLKECVPRPATAPSRPPRLKQQGSPVHKPGIAPSAACPNSRMKRRGTNEMIITPSQLNTPSKAVGKSPDFDKPLPKLPFKYSTFPTSIPPRKSSIDPPQSLTQLQPQLQSRPERPPTRRTNNKIISVSELDRRFTDENQPTGIGAKLRKASISAGILHRRGLSMDSWYGIGASSTWNSNTTGTTAAVVSSAEVAINGYGMKSKLVSVGKTIPRSLEVPSPHEGNAARGRTLRRAASDDTIISGSGSWRKTEHRKAEIPQLKTTTGKFHEVWPGAVSEDQTRKFPKLEVPGGRTIAIGIIPQ